MKIIIYNQSCFLGTLHSFLNTSYTKAKVRMADKNVKDEQFLRIADLPSEWKWCFIATLTSPVLQPSL